MGIRNPNQDVADNATLTLVLNNKGRRYSPAVVVPYNDCSHVERYALGLS